MSSFSDLGGRSPKELRECSLCVLHFSAAYASSLSFWLRIVVNEKSLNIKKTKSSILSVVHPELTRVRNILFLFFEIKRAFVYISTIFKLTDLFILYFFIQNVYANKKWIKKKGYKVMYKGSNCDRKSQLSEILTEPLNPRASRTAVRLLWKQRSGRCLVFRVFNQAWQFRDVLKVVFFL